MKDKITGKPEPLLPKDRPMHKGNTVDKISENENYYSNHIHDLSSLRAQRGPPLGCETGPLAIGTPIRPDAEPTCCPLLAVTLDVSAAVGWF